MGASQSQSNTASEETLEAEDICAEAQGDDEEKEEFMPTVQTTIVTAPSAESSSSKSTHTAGTSSEDATSKQRSAHNKNGDSKHIAFDRFQNTLLQSFNKTTEFEQALKECVKNTNYFKDECNKKLATLIENAIEHIGMTVILNAFFAQYEQAKTSPLTLEALLGKYSLCIAHLPYEDLVEHWKAALLSTSDLASFAQGLTLLNEHFDTLFPTEGMTFSDFINALALYISKLPPLDKNAPKEKMDQLRIHLQKLNYLKSKNMLTEELADSDEIASLVAAFFDHLISSGSLNHFHQELEAFSSLPKPKLNLALLLPLLPQSDLPTFTQNLFYLDTHFSELFSNEETSSSFMNSLIHRIKEALNLDERNLTQTRLYLQKFHSLKEQGWSNEAWAESEDIKELINRFTDSLLSHESLDTCIQELQAISALPKPDSKPFLDFFSFQFAGIKDHIQTLFTDIETRFAPFLSFDDFIDAAMKELVNKLSLYGTDGEQAETALCEKFALLISKKPVLELTKIYIRDLETETEGTGALESSLVVDTVKGFIEHARQKAADKIQREQKEKDEKLRQERIQAARKAFQFKNIFATNPDLATGAPSAMPQTNSSHFD